MALRDNPTSSTPSSAATLVPRVTLPPLLPPTPEEIARRRTLFAKVMALREQIGPIGITTDELVHQTRAGADVDTSGVAHLWCPVSESGPVRSHRA